MLFVCLGMEAMSSGIINSLHICFLVAGHAKFAPDRLFASCSKSYNVADAFNVDKLKSIYAKHSMVSLATDKHIHPLRKYLDECYTDLPEV